MALAITESIYRPEHRRVGGILSNYDVLLRKLDRNKDAKRHEKRAREILTRHSRENFLHLTVDLSELQKQSGG